MNPFKKHKKLSIIHAYLSFSTRPVFGVLSMKLDKNEPRILRQNCNIDSVDQLVRYVENSSVILCLSGPAVFMEHNENGIDSSDDSIVYQSYFMDGMLIGRAKIHRDILEQLRTLLAMADIKPGAEYIGVFGLSAYLHREGRDLRLSDGLHFDHQNIRWSYSDTPSGPVNMVYGKYSVLPDLIPALAAFLSHYKLHGISVASGEKEEPVLKGKNLKRAVMISTLILVLFGMSRLGFSLAKATSNKDIIEDIEVYPAKPEFSKAFLLDFICSLQPDGIHYTRVTVNPEVIEEKWSNTNAPSKPRILVEGVAENELKVWRLIDRIVEDTMVRIELEGVKIDKDDEEVEFNSVFTVL